MKKKIKEEYLKFKNIFLSDPIYNQRILDLLRSNCNLYVHGHSAGGTIGTNGNKVNSNWIY